MGMTPAIIYDAVGKFYTEYGRPPDKILLHEDDFNNIYNDTFRGVFRYVSTEPWPCKFLLHDIPVEPRPWVEPGYVRLYADR